MKPLLCLLLAHPLLLVAADFRLAPVLSDHMVLQRDKPVAIWGWADPGEQVSVSFDSQTKSTTANSSGKWSVLLEPLSTRSTPLTLTASGTGSRKIVVSDILVGEVWLGSGQSNMAFSVRETTAYETEKPKALFPLIRSYREASGPSTNPEPLGKGEWSVCSPETVGSFSGVQYFFGREIHTQLDGVPVGLINSSVGGTRIESWIPAEAQMSDPDTKESYDQTLKAFLEFDPEKAPELFEKQKAIWRAAVEKAKANNEFPPYPPKDPLAMYKLKGGPAGLFNGKIANLVPYTLRGILWYQGEGNTPNGPLYRKQLTELVTSWRGLWQEEVPFAWVQLPNYFSKGDGWPLVRQSMLECLALPKTGMAITIDLGEKNEIHPRNKKDVGIRLAFWALNQVYQKPIDPYSGPLFDSVQAKQNSVHIQFRQAGGQLKTADGAPLKGFDIQTLDGAWLPAKAEVEGDHVVISHPVGQPPAAIRYAWASWPDANLCNRVGLPASPFQAQTPKTGAPK
jgi:sialate O-acetylesterase